MGVTIWQGGQYLQNQYPLTNQWSVLCTQQLGAALHNRCKVTIKKSIYKKKRRGMMRLIISWIRLLNRTICKGTCHIHRQTHNPLTHSFLLKRPKRHSHYVPSSPRRYWLVAESPFLSDVTADRITNKTTNIQPGWLWGRLSAGHKIQSSRLSALSDDCVASRIQL